MNNEKKQTLEKFLCDSLIGREISIGRSSKFKKVINVDIPREGNYIIDFEDKSSALVDRLTSIQVRDENIETKLNRIIENTES